MQTAPLADTATVNAPIVDGFYDPNTFTISYVVTDPQTGLAAVIDPVLDYDPSSGAISNRSAQRLIEHIRETGAQLQWILETHAHADHLSGAQVIKDALGGRLVIGEHIQQVQSTFSELFDLGDDFPTDGSQFDKLVADRDELPLGELSIKVIHTPGHTPACVSYLIDDALFVGDTLFLPDYGTARADFPGGDARALYRSIRRLLSLPADTRMYMCHDYPPKGRLPAWETSVGEQRENNIHVHDGIDENTFVEQRCRRDSTLPAPNLILPSLQVNIRAGSLPEPHANGVRYLQIPLNQLGGGD
nr:MBL fold metallo-hydrolase [Oceanococcus sp. HetDA_MAG_MS8]